MTSNINMKIQLSVMVKTKSKLWVLVPLFLVAALFASCKKEKLPDPVKPEATWTHFSTLNSGIVGDQVNAIVIGLDGKKWIGTATGLALLQNDQWTNFDEA